MSEYLRNAIDSLGKWYQQIDLDGTLTCDHRLGGGDYFWDQMQKHVLPQDLSGKRILDLGSNAGCYCVRSAIAGASEVIGVELKHEDISKAIFIKSFFEEKHNRKFPIQYLQADISEMDLTLFGHFDYVYAIAILYHIGSIKYGQNTEMALAEQKRIISIICGITDNVIARTSSRRKYRTTEYFDKIFKLHNFKIAKRIPDGYRELVHWKKSIL